MPIFSGGGGGGGASIGLTVLTGSANGTDYTTTLATWADVDSTNLKSSALLVATGKKAYIFAWFAVRTSANIGCEVGISVDSATPSDSGGIGNYYMGANSFFGPFSLMSVFTGDNSTHTFSLQWFSATAGQTMTMLNSKAGGSGSYVASCPRVLIEIA